MLTLFKNKTKIVFFFLVTLFFFLDGTPFIFSDGYGYYHTAKTLVNEGNFVTTSEPEYYMYARHGVEKYQGKYVTRYSPGTAVLSLPLFFISNVFDNETTFDNYYKAYNGHSLLDGIAFLVSCVIYFMVSVFFLNGMLKHFKLSKSVRIVSITVSLISSYIYTYTFENIGYSHIFEVFTISGLMYFSLSLLKKLKTKENLPSKELIAVGVFEGLVLIVRPTNLLVTLPVLLYIYLFFFKTVQLKKSIKYLFFLLLSMLPLIFIYLIYNYQSYGGVLINGYSVLAGQRVNLENFSLFEILFSDVRGWFVYSPLAFVVFTFFISRLFRKQDHYNLVLTFLISIILNILLYSFWPMWWAGDSVGNRFFINLVPFITVGTGLLLRELSSKTRIIRLTFYLFISLFTFYSFLVNVLVRVTPTGDLFNILNKKNKYPEISAEEEFSAMDIFHYHYINFTQSEDINAFIGKTKNGLRGGRSILLLLLGETDPVVKTEKISLNEFTLHLIPNSVKSAVDSEVVLVINYQNHFFKYCSGDFDFSTYKKLDFVCDNNVCTEGGVNLSKVESSMSENSIILSDFLSLDLYYEGDKVKFIDYKL